MNETQGRAPIVAVGLGATSSVGRGVDALRRALHEGRHGMTPVRRFDTAELAGPCFGGCVPHGDSATAWAVEAAREAWRDARADEAILPPERVAVVVGTAEGEAGDMNRIARAVAAAVGARGPQWTVSSACSSSANAIGLGCDLLERGDADRVIAGGAEKLSLETLAGFHRLGVLAKEPCTPFGEARGTTLGEGAGFVVLEHDGARAIAPWAFVNGYALSSDAWHETTPEPRGRGLARAMRAALDHAGLAPEDVGYVNVHGTGTAANDDAEWRGIRQVFGTRSDALPVSATKSVLGHAQGAAGVLELAAALTCLREGTVPPTLRVGRGRPTGPPDPVASDRPRAAVVTHMLSNSAAFGGANAVVCAGRASSPRPARRREVRILGFGVARTAPAAARDEAGLRDGASFDLRHADPSILLALAASRRALADAGVVVRGALRERAGILGAATRVSPTSAAEYRASAERGGFGRVSAPAFSRLVLHAPVGAVSRLLSLRGPATTLATADTGGLLAFVYAADWLARRDDADVILACGFDERDADVAVEEGAACAVLAASDDPTAPRVAAVASAGPGSAADAIDAALRRARRTRSEVTAWFRHDRPHPDAPSLRGAMLMLDAARAVSSGARVAVAVADGPSLSCAVVIVP